MIERHPESIVTNTIVASKTYPSLKGVYETVHAFFNMDVLIALGAVISTQTIQALAWRHQT